MARLTRVERALRRVGVGLATLLAVTFGAGVVLQRCSPVHAPSGRLLHVDGARLHLDCRGESGAEPTMVAEAGLGLNAQAFYWLQQQLKSTARFCRYDRAGMGFSDASDAPKDADTVARQLHALLNRAQVGPPYVMLGHSLGGSYVRVFADRHPDEVTALVLLDSTHPRQLELLRGESVEDGAGRLRALAMAADVGLVHLLTSIFGGLADAGLPAREAAVNRAFYRVGKDLRTTARELAASPAVFARAARTKPLGARPLLVFTAAEQPSATKAAWLQMQRELSLLSTQGKHFSVPGADHVSLLTQERNARFVAQRIRELYE